MIVRLLKNKYSYRSSSMGGGQQLTVRLLVLQPSQVAVFRRGRCLLEAEFIACGVYCEVADAEGFYCGALVTGAQFPAVKVAVGGLEHEIEEFGGCADCGATDGRGQSGEGEGCGELHDDG
jgi:hypothetical protein